MDNPAQKLDSHYRGSSNPDKIPLGAKLALFLSKNTVAGRGKFRKILGTYVKSKIGTRVKTKLWGTQVNLYPHTNQCDYKLMMKPSQYSRKEFSFLDDYLSEGGAVFFDIGANSGFFSLYAAAMAKENRQIFSFEPNPEMIRRLKEKFEATENKSALSNADWTLCPYALGDQDGRAFLAIPDTNYGEAHVSDTNEGIEITIKSLKSVIKEHSLQKINVLKIDVEGYEDRIMQTLFSNVSKQYWPKAIIIEHVNSDEWQWNPITFALENGYKNVFKTRNNMALVYQG